MKTLTKLATKNNKQIQQKYFTYYINKPSTSTKPNNTINTTTTTNNTNTNTTDKRVIPYVNFYSKESSALSSLITWRDMEKHGINIYKIYSHI